MHKEQISAVQALLVNQLLSFLSHLSTEEKEAFFNKIFSVYCRFCFNTLDASKKCYCTRDE